MVGGQGAWVAALSLIAYLAVSIYPLHASGTPQHDSKKKKCLQILPDVNQKAKLSPIYNHGIKGVIL